jgi:4Fe-4S single cluster protein
MGVMEMKPSATAPWEVFQMKEGDEKAEVIKAEGGPEDLIQEAMDTCPAEGAGVPTSHIQTLAGIFLTSPINLAHGKLSAKWTG